MDFFKMFFGQDNSSYSLTMIIIYIVVVMVAFGICVLISHKLKIYSHKTYKAKANVKFKVKNPITMRTAITTITTEN